MRASALGLAQPAAVSVPKSAPRFAARPWCTLLHDVKGEAYQPKAYPLPKPHSRDGADMGKAVSFVPHGIPLSPAEY